jgi:hypothetical protein
LSRPLDGRRCTSAQSGNRHHQSNRSTVACGTRPGAGSHSPPSSSSSPWRSPRPNNRDTPSDRSWRRTSARNPWDRRIPRSSTPYTRPRTQDSRNGGPAHHTPPERPRSRPDHPRHSANNARNTLSPRNHSRPDPETPNDNRVSLHTPRACPPRRRCCTRSPCNRLRTNRCRECTPGTTPDPLGIAPPRHSRPSRRSRHPRRSRHRRFLHPGSCRLSRRRPCRRCPRWFRRRSRPWSRSQRLLTRRLTLLLRRCSPCRHSRARIRPSSDPIPHRRRSPLKRPAARAENLWRCTRSPSRPERPRRG